MKAFLSLLLVPLSAFAQYKAEPAGAPAAGIPPEVAAVLQQDGHRILDAGGKPLIEVWFRGALPKASLTEENATINTVAHGALLGVMKILVNYPDRRGQTIKPGLYTLRYSLFPINGAHQGVEPQRDFLLLLNADTDKDPNSTPDYKAVTDQSMKAVGAAHPGVLSIWKAEAAEPLGFAKEGESDWALRVKIGDLPLAVILFGQSAH
ncbi:MAG TPA: hypothetical protein DEH78_31010 [Solibacterales bacterium]|nr:hypothetical protein [Bryobacterales bacterium]